MPGGDFHRKAFDEGTLTKLQIFELYTREWLPVLLASLQPRMSEIAADFDVPQIARLASPRAVRLL